MFYIWIKGNGLGLNAEAFTFIFERRITMKFNDLLDLKPDITLGELIQLFLLGYDDKIYIDIEDKGEMIL